MPTRARSPRRSRRLLPQIAYDIYREYFNPEATGAKILLVSRVVIVCFGIFMGAFAVSVARRRRIRVPVRPAVRPPPSVLPSAALPRRSPWTTWASTSDG